jgi:hypothetical protein
MFHDRHSSRREKTQLSDELEFTTSIRAKKITVLGVSFFNPNSLTELRGHAPG